MRQWYSSYGGDATGWFDHVEAVAQVRKAPDSHAWREGFAKWFPIQQIGPLPFSCLVGRISKAASQLGGRKGENSLLGAWGGLISGDNR